MPTAVIVDAIRTPAGKGKPNGALSSIHPADLLSRVLRELTVRSGLDPALIDDVIAGCVSQAGEQSFNIGRNAVLGAGFPESVPATTVDRQCGSSQQAVHFAAQSVLAGAYDIVIACGVESMSRVQMDSPAAGKDAAGPAVAARYPAGRDETAYEKAEVIDFHRGHVKHQAFGGGVHRCLGSHLARTELIVGLEAVLDMIPESISTRATPTHSRGWIDPKRVEESRVFYSDVLGLGPDPDRPNFPAAPGFWMDCDNDVQIHLIGSPTRILPLRTLPSAYPSSRRPSGSSR
jgi:Thiolase, N-terminal domain